MLSLEAVELIRQAAPLHNLSIFYVLFELPAVLVWVREHLFYMVDRYVANVFV